MVDQHLGTVFGGTVNRPERRRESTSTSNFGVGRREGHDSSAFYGRFPLPKIDDDEHVVRQHPESVDRLWVGDAREMDHHGTIADSSVALVITSPPYFAGKEYEEAVGEGHIPATYIDYLEMLHDVFAECVHKLEPGGRIAVNVANLGRRPYRSLSADVIDILQNRLNLLLRGEVIWRKARGTTGSCAWGTFQQPGNPVLRDLTERVVIASKGRFGRARRAADRAEEGLPSVGSAFADEYMEATTDVWEIPPASATRVGHPAPFPVELPERLIELYTYRNDLVLDPFMGAGTTAVAAVRTGRHYAGFDTDHRYVQLAEERVAAERLRLTQLRGPARWEVEIPATTNGHRRSAGFVNLGDLPASAPGGRNGGVIAGHSAGESGGSAPQTQATRNDGDLTNSACPPGNSPALDGRDGAFSIQPASNSENAAEGAATEEGFQARAVREGLKARALAEQILEQSGFRAIREQVRCPGGVQVNFEALDQTGRRWRFDVSGAFTITQRPGLRRTDTLWKALGKAAALQCAEQAAGNQSPPPLVLLTTDRPARNSTGQKALAATTGVDKPIHAVIEMLKPEDLKTLADLARGTPARAASASPSRHSGTGPPDLQPSKRGSRPGREPTVRPSG